MNFKRTFDPNGIPLNKDAKMINLERSKCAEAATWSCMVDRNCKAMNPSLVPKPDHTIPVILNQPNNDPFNRPSIIKVMIVPEEFMLPTMDLDYRYATQKDGKTTYHTKVMEVHRSSFKLPTEECDNRFGIDPNDFKNFKQMSQKNFFWEIPKIFELDMLYTIFRFVEHYAVG